MVDYDPVTGCHGSLISAESLYVEPLHIVAKIIECGDVLGNIEVEDPVIGVKKHQFSESPHLMHERLYVETVRYPMQHETSIAVYETGEVNLTEFCHIGGYSSET